MTKERRYCRTYKRCYTPPQNRGIPNSSFPNRASREKRMMATGLLSWSPSGATTWVTSWMVASAVAAAVGNRCRKRTSTGSISSRGTAGTTKRNKKTFRKGVFACRFASKDYLYATAAVEMADTPAVHYARLAPEKKTAIGHTNSTRRCCWKINDIPATLSSGSA